MSVFGGEGDTLLKPVSHLPKEPRVCRMSQLWAQGLAQAALSGHPTPHLGEAAGDWFLTQQALVGAGA